MDWHNFKVLSMFGVIVCVILLIAGKPGFAILALVTYSSCGLISVLKAAGKSRKIEKALVGVPEHICEIVKCHVVKRDKSLKKQIVKLILNDINTGNYRVDICIVTGKTCRLDDSGEPSMCFLIFDDSTTKSSMVYDSVYSSVEVGDILYRIKTSGGVISVIKTKTEYINMFSIGTVVSK